MQRLYSFFIIILVLIISVALVQAQESPTQLSPANNATLTSPIIPFQWSAVDNVKVYVLKVKNLDGTYKYKGKATPSVAGCADLSSCTFTPSDFDWSLKHNTAYKWKVVAKINDGSKSKTETRQFTTNFPVPGAFSLISPANNASFQDSYTPTFQWNPSANATLYKVVVKNSSGQAILKNTLSSCGTTCQMTFNEAITTAGTYKWKVVANNSYGKTKATPFKFTITTSGPNYQTEMLRLVNIERCSRGLEPLALNDKLNTAAVKHSEDMANNNFFSHTGSNDSSPWDRIESEGYYGATGENIAAGTSSVQQVFDMWMGSDGHRNNILNANAREMGIGYGYNSNSDWRHYWTQVFGARNSDVLGTCP